MRHHPRRASIVVGTAAVVVLLGSTSAFAYWTVTGSGSGSATATTFTPPVVSAGTVSGALLYPGLTADGQGTGGSLALTASNPNPFPVTVTVSQSGSATGCTTPDVSVRPRSFTLPARSGTVLRTLDFTVSMGTGASNDCQGKTLSIPLTTSSTSG